MKKNLILCMSAIAVCIVAQRASAAPTSIDGVLGSEWAGANVVNVGYNATAPESNFGAPTNENKYGAYSIYTRGDAGYLYVGLQSGANYAGGLDFANLYFDTQLTGSKIGFEVQNERAFIPGVSTGGPLSNGLYPYTQAGADIHFATTSGGGVTPSVIEFAVPWAVFTSNALNLDTLPLATSQVRLNLSQSFGYSVAGGQDFYGSTRLGQVQLPVPEPTTVALVGLATICLTALRRRQA